MGQLLSGRAIPMIARPLNAVRASSKRRWVGLLIAALALQVSLFGRTNSCAAAVDGMSDVTIVSDLYGQTRLRIPRAYYMSGPTGAVFKSYGTVVLEVALPDMRARKAHVPLRGTKDSAEWLQSLEENRAGLTIFILPRETAKNLYERYKKEYETRYRKEDSSQFELALYRRVGCSSKANKSGDEPAAKLNCYVAPNEYFLSPELPGGNVIVFDCAPESERSILNGCTARTALKKLDIEYLFRRSELHRWREIDQAVRDFVQKLILE